MTGSPDEHADKTILPCNSRPLANTVTLRVDDVQLSHLLENLNASTSGKLDFKDLASLIQVLALVVGGAWGLYEFLSFQSEQNRLTLDQQRFAVQQQGLAESSAKLSLSLQERQEELAGLQIGKAHEGRYHIETSARASLVHMGHASSQYWVEYTFNIANVSDQEFSVTYSVLEVFLGMVAGKLTDGARIIKLNPPPNLHVAPEPGGVLWKRIHGETHVYDQVPDIASELLKSAGYKPIRGGGGTGVLRAAESAKFEQDFLIDAKPDAWVGFVVNWGMDFGYRWNARGFRLKDLLPQQQTRQASVPPG